MDSLSLIWMHLLISFGKIKCTMYFFKYFQKIINIKGVPASLVDSPNGAQANSVIAFKDGIVTRGVLLDITKVRKVE
jgi:hypothetical protein